MKVLMIDDDAALAGALANYLGQHQIDVETVSDTAGAQEILNSQAFDAVLLDVLLPETSGFDFLPMLRHASNAHVIMLTALGEEDDRVTGLNLGADDYITKPFSAKELVARLRAVRRRRLNLVGENARLLHHDLELCPGENIARIGGRRVSLTSVECCILKHLMLAPDKTVSREALYGRVLGRATSPLDRSLDTHISNLRRKLGPHETKGVRIRAIRNFGYALTC